MDVDVVTSRSRVLETNAVIDAHRAIAARARAAIALLRAGGDAGVALEQARKLQNYFGQPFYVAEEYTKRSGTTVPLREALDTCRDILDGRYDDWSTEAFYFAGGLDEIRARAGRQRGRRIGCRGGACPRPCFNQRAVGTRGQAPPLQER